MVFEIVVNRGPKCNMICISGTKRNFRHNNNYHNRQRHHRCRPVVVLVVAVVVNILVVDDAVTGTPRHTVCWVALNGFAQRGGLF